MKKICYILTILICVAFNNAKAQLLSWSPEFIQEASNTIEITVDGTSGNKALQGFATLTDVFVHTGVITTASTSSSDWKFSKFTWGTANAAANAPNVGANKWKFTITGGLRAFYGVTNPSEKILKIAILFRSGNGNTVQRNADGSDMYVPVYDNGVYARIDVPLRTPMFNMGFETINKSINDNIAITAKASQASDIKLYFNGALLSTTTSATQASANPTITANGNQEIVAEAIVGSVKHSDTLRFLVAPPVNVAPLPTSVLDGINYDAADPTKVTLVVHAPGKNRIAVIGDFNNWTETTTHQMNKTPDGNKFWITISGLTSGVEYGFQYKIDNTIITGDAYAEKVLDPWNDGFIPVSKYPSLKAYPTGKTNGIVSIFQTNKPSYTWQVPNFNRPNKKNLIIYEMLIRDFTAAQSYTSIKDTLSYLKRLGINCLQLMPINEFDGNLSWGYNPAYFFAPDKFYGTETAFKQLVDECHKLGIAVVLDVALNHTTGANPLAAMYWDASTNKPAANNPWLNVDARHPFNVFNDFNHESAVTKQFTARFIRHWLTNYKIDGFRWDLSKGFTQVNSGSDVGAWGNYDASRITIWKRYYDSMMAVSPNSYCILEHFGGNTEEKELSDYGMLLWGNANYSFREAAKGNTAGSDFSAVSHITRGWSQPHLIGYAESHDEERVMFDALNNGRSSGPYNIRDTVTALKRAEQVAAFVAMTPGPKMIWQFGELGFHYSINRCTNGTIDNSCRVAEKPLFWFEKNNANRSKLYDVYAKLFKLRTNPTYEPAFLSSTGGFLASGTFKQMVINDAGLRINVVGNFDVNATTQSVPFPTNGLWFDALKDTFITVTGNSHNMTFAPGDYYVFVDKNVNSIPTSIFNPGYNLIDLDINIHPNPIQQSSYIKYNLPENGNVNIMVMDISGRVISNLFKGYRTKGQQVLTIEKEKLSKTIISGGTYLLQIDVNGKKQTKKFTIM